ncbi:hypothetical protein ES707_14859 [subsurface metagenome]|jgi:hypothetical protein
MWVLREIWKGEPWYSKVFMFLLYMKAQMFILRDKLKGRYNEC